MNRNEFSFECHMCALKLHEGDSFVIPNQQAVIFSNGIQKEF